MKILHRDDLTLGGFAGLREHRLVVSSKAFESKREADSWEGLGNFVYLADASIRSNKTTPTNIHQAHY